MIVLRVAWRLRVFRVRDGGRVIGVGVRWDA